MEGVEIRIESGLWRDWETCSLPLRRGTKGTQDREQHVTFRHGWKEPLWAEPRCRSLETEWPEDVVEGWAEGEGCDIQRLCGSYLHLLSSCLHLHTCLQPHPAACHSCRPVSACYLLFCLMIDTEGFEGMQSIRDLR